MSGILETFREGWRENPHQALLIVALALATGCIAGYRILAPALLG